MLLLRNWSCGLHWDVSHHYHRVAWGSGMRDWRKKRKILSSLWALGGPFPAPPAGTRRFLLDFSLFMPTPVLGFRLYCAQAGGYYRKKMGRLTTDSVVLQLAFFSNVPTNIDFSESSDSCSMYSVQILQLYSVGDTGWSALTPFYPEPEPKDFFRHTKLKELIIIRSSLQKNVKGSLSDRRKMIPDENMDGHKGTESIRNGVWINIKKSFSYF